MVILVDDDNASNEGNLFIPAQMITPDAINFMAKYCRGLVCLALGQERSDQLGLTLQAPERAGPHQKAYAVSIEARDGVTTGISAADRARTVTVAIDPAKGRDEIVTPGHVFPLIARNGGVLVRAGIAEAVVDIAKLAGLNPSGVICPIMNDDGSMANLPQLEQFATHHAIKIGTIRDLIAYRRQHDRLVERQAEVTFSSKWGGEWRGVTYLNRIDGSEQLALIKGTISQDRATLVRMHTLSFYTDVFGDQTERSGLIENAMQMMAAEGAGVLVLLNRPMSHVLTRMTRLRAQGSKVDDAVLSEIRDYGIGAQILADLGVRDMTLLTNSSHSLVGLAGYGINIVGERAIATNTAG
jgi:3,4-dihydroxy 2-butanone 4-phosphate synthase/GTP cyclohydrolase II